MSASDVVIQFSQREIQEIQQAILDADEASALDFLRRVLKPKVDEILNRPLRRPVFKQGG